MRRIGRWAICLTSLLASGCATEQIRSFESFPASSPSENAISLSNVGLDELQKQALISYESRDYDKSEKLHRALVQRSPIDADAWLRLGNIYGRSSRPDDAVKAYREALVRKPSLAKAWHNMGVVQLQEAANSFQQMLLHVPEEDPLWLSAKRTRSAVLAVLRGRTHEPQEQTALGAPEL